MDSAFLIQQLRQFIFTLASSGATVFLGTLAIGVFGLGPIGRAIAARIRSSHPSQLPPEDPSLPALKAAMGEVLERLDFSERVLTELHDRTLSPGVTPLKHRTPREVTPV